MRPIKLFFDECCSKRLARRVSEVYSQVHPGIQTKHLSEFCACSTPDETWIPLLEKEQDWIIITADRGRDSKKQKLPLICFRIGVTHISMTPALKNAGYAVHEKALFAVWDQILMVPLLPAGTRVALGFKMHGKE